MNKVIIIGNVGAEPDYTEFQTGGCVATLRVATTIYGRTLDNGQKIEDRTDWHNVVLNGKLGKFAKDYIHKGDKVAVEGELRNRQYNDKQGVTHYVTEIYTRSIEILARPMPKQEPANPVPQGEF